MGVNGFVNGFFKKLHFAIIKGYLCTNIFSEMIISYQWLLGYLPKPIPVNDLGGILTSIGLEVEAIEPIESIKGGLEGLLIGEVLTCAKHPNADKLSVTTVNTGGSAPVQIVCGAPNVAAGQKVVVAPVGATVHPTEGEPFLIKKAKIRGEESSGMICAEDEIGLGKSHAGIMILPADAEVGMLAKEYFNIPQTDYAIHIGLTPNRSDANSHIGVAKDVCAYLTHHKGERHTAVLPQIHPTTLPDGQYKAVNVHITAANACLRYAGQSITNVQVGPSPEWLKARLQTVGVRSINNIVDITNYVLHEYGQPLHAFDADKLADHSIGVQFLPEGSVFKGLDGKERKLAADDLMITSGGEAIAMGGVFGGQDSGITEATTHVFLESAYFDAKHVRRSSLRHNLRTDAATHFEKGVDINNVIPALQRAAALIAELAGGTIATPVNDVYPATLPERTVTVTYDYIWKLSGKHYSAHSIKEVLLALGFAIAEETDEALTLYIPSNKTDVSQPADIVEEILRIDGLDNITIPDRLNISLKPAMKGDRELRERTAGLLCGMGAQEIVTNSIVNSKYYPGNENLVKMVNSLSADLDVMRPSMLEGGLEVVQFNCNRKNQNLFLFEFGNIYAQADAKYYQQARMGIWISGQMRTAAWSQKAMKADIYYLKGIIGNLLQYCGIKNDAAVSADGEVVWKWKNQTLCTASAVPSARLGEFDIKQEVYYAEIHWDNWVKAQAAAKIKYSEIPKFPAVQRDLAIVIDTAITYKQVQDITQQLKLEPLQSFGLFDVFESEKLGKGKKSYALNYTFQLQDRTLTDADTEQLMKQLIEAYTTKLSAQIRD